MNCFSSISVGKPLVGGVTGSRCRLKIAGLPVAVMVKLTAAAALDEVSVTRWLGGCKATRMMSTADGGARDHYNGQEVVAATETLASHMKRIFSMPKDRPKVRPSVAVGVEDIITDSWESLQKKIMDVPDLRTEEEMSAIFERWSAHYNKTYATAAQKKRRFEVFRKKMKDIDFQNVSFGSYSEFKLQLDAHCDLTAWEYLMGLKKGKFQ